MTKPFQQPSHQTESNEPDWIARAAALKQQLMQRRLRTATVQPDKMSFSQDAPGPGQQQEQPTSGRNEPVQTRTTAVAEAQSIPGQSHRLPDGRGMDKEASQLKKPSTLLSTPDQFISNGVQSSPAITEKLLEMLSSSKSPKAAGKDVNDALTVVNDARRDTDAPSSANDHPVAKVQQKPDDGARGKVQQGDDSTAMKEAHASHSSTKSTVVLKDKPNTQSSAEEGEITSNNPSAPLRKIPVQESTRQPASRKTPPTRVPTVTSIAPTEPHAKRQPSGSLKATPGPKHRVQAGAGRGTGAPPSAFRYGGRHEHGRASLPVRQGRQDDDARITREAYRSPPSPPSAHRRGYARPSREQRPRSASPFASRPIGDRDWEMQDFDFRDPDLRDWLRLTGWDKPHFRNRELARLRRLEEIERESAELRKQGEREMVRLKAECGEPASEARHLSDSGHRPRLMPPAPPRRTEDVEPAEYRMLGRYTVTAGIKRERDEEGDGDADGFSTKYYRTNRNDRVSRAGYHGYHHRGHEDSRHWQNREDRRRSGRLSPPRVFPDSSPSRYLPKRHPQRRFPSPVGHPRPRDQFDDECETDLYLTRDTRPPPRYHPHRSSSSPPNVPAYKLAGFHKSSEYGRPR